MAVSGQGGDCPGGCRMTSTPSRTTSRVPKQELKGETTSPVVSDGR